MRRVLCLCIFIRVIFSASFTLAHSQHKAFVAKRKTVVVKNVHKAPVKKVAVRQPVHMKKKHHAVKPAIVIKL